MKKIMAIALMSSVSMVYAGNLFTVSGTSSSITVGSNVPNHTYSKVGIKMTQPGFILSNVGTECAEIANGYCVFELSDSSPKTLTLSGTGDTVGLSLCLNAFGPVSCEQFSYSGNGGVQLTDYVYIVNKGDNTISLCQADTTGAISNCQLSGAEASLNNPTSITFDPTGQYAYILNFSTRPFVLGCTVGSDKTLSSCTSSGPVGTVGGTTSASQISYATVSGTDYVYLTAPNTNSGQSRVFRCPVAASTVSICAGLTVSNGPTPINTPNFTGLYVSGGDSMMYLVDNSGSTLYNCPVSSSLSVSCTSSLSTVTNPEFLSLDVAGSPAFLPSFASGIYQYPIVSGSIVSSGSGLSSASSNFDNPNQATPNTAGTYAFVSNRASNTVSSCAINPDKTFGTCTLATQSFNTPYGVAVLPN